MHNIFHKLTRLHRVKGWSDSYKKWIEGFLFIGSTAIETGNGDVFLREAFIIPENTVILKSESETYCIPRLIAVNPYTICRYTGISIERGVPIYEFDKVKFIHQGKPRIDIVVNREGEWVFKLYKVGLNEVDLRDVVGNMKQNYRYKKVRRPIIESPGLQ